MEELFTNKEELITFSNLKAKKRIMDSEKIKKECDVDLEETMKKADELFQKYGVQNYINEIIGINAKIQRLGEQRYGEELDEVFARKDELLSDYEAFLAGLPLEDRENLEFYVKIILDRKERINSTDELISRIENSYPDARNLIVEEAFSKVGVLRDIKRTLEPEESTVRLEDNEVSTLPYVTKVTSLSDEIEEEPVVDVKPEEIKSDTSFFDPEDDLAASIENEVVVPTFSEVEEKEPDKIEIPEVEVDDAGIASLFAETTEEPTELEIPTGITYSMEDGDSLSVLAETICGSEKGWKDIYEANKDAIVKRCEEKGLTFNEGLIYDDKSFSGLSLIIPNEFKSLEKHDDSPSFSLAA